MQAEYFQIDVNRETNDDLDFSASYVEGWYYLTGEGRSYKPKKGTFGRIKPKKYLLLKILYLLNQRKIFLMVDSEH